MVSIKEYINPNTLFKISGPLLVILSFSRNVDFGDTGKNCQSVLIVCIFTTENNVY